MEKQSLPIKILKFWSDLWDKVTWPEIIILFILGKLFLMYIALNVATYHVSCDDGSVEEIHINSTYLCGREVHVERHVSLFGVSWSIDYTDTKQNGIMDYNFGNISSIVFDNLSAQR